MVDPYPLSTLLRGSASGAVDPVAFERLLQAAVDAARARWPSFTLSHEVFIPYLAQRLPAVSSLALERLHVTELYLACACAEGDPAAIAAFEATYLRDIASVLPKPGRGASIEGDATQAIRERLFVRRAKAPPRVADYSGRGDLAGWVHVVAVRTAITMLRGRKHEVELDGQRVLASKAKAEDAEIAYLKKHYREEFAEAFHAALGTLEPRDRNVLRQHYVDGLTMDQIGVAYCVHRNTVVHWVDRARAALAKDTKRRLAGKLGIGKREIESIIRLIQSQLDVSLRGHLR
jgi:RNA polymerase sigma-70 factor (ECF subfamily)